MCINALPPPPRSTVGGDLWSLPLLFLSPCWKKEKCSHTGLFGLESMNVRGTQADPDHSPWGRLISRLSHGKGGRRRCNAHGAITCWLWDLTKGAAACLRNKTRRNLRDVLGQVGGLCLTPVRPVLAALCTRSASKGLWLGNKRYDVFTPLIVYYSGDRMAVPPASTFLEV